MEIEIGGGIHVKLNESDKTSAVCKSPKATGNIIIPQFVNQGGTQYLITSISSHAFSYCKIESLTFAEDSEVTFFDDRIFEYATIKKLQIPPKLRKIDNYWLSSINEMFEIEISPENKNFKFINNQFLVGKSKPDSETFDTLYYARDTEEAVIPSQINFLINYIFRSHKKLKSIIFPSNSKITEICDIFSPSTISRLVLPASISKIHSNNFKEVSNLVDIEISPENKNYKMIDKKLLFMKSDRGKFDSLVFCRRDAKEITIPDYTKEIVMYSFANVKNIQKIIFPQNMESVGTSAFYNDKNLKFIEFLSKTVKISSWAFSYCNNLSVVTFPNATKIISVYSDPLAICPNTTIFKVRRNVEFHGNENGINSFKKQIKYVEENSPTINKETKQAEKTHVYEDLPKSKKVIKDQPDQMDEIEILKKRIRYLESRLKKYEPIPPIDENTGEYLNNDKEIESKTINNNNIFIDDKEEEFHEVMCKIGEGSTSVAFKIIDKRTGETMCKKILKTDESNKNNFEQFRNNLKEFEVLHMINHPCICKAIGLNVHEKISTTNEEKCQDENSDSDSEYDEHSKRKKKKEGLTTIAIFMKYQPYSLKNCLETDQLNNTLKVKISLEIAFGMSHVHSLGMIHRDLKVDNVMLDYIYEAKLIDFGLVHVDEVSGSKYSLTKGVGTLAYMSPEMASEEDYDNKTDVYSYGVLLHVIFSGRLPKQSLKEKITNKEARLSKSSPSISKYCLEMIKRCMSFESKNRPTFDEIIKDFYEHQFKLATEIDFETILHRYQTLNQLRTLTKKTTK